MIHLEISRGKYLVFGGPAMTRFWCCFILLSSVLLVIVPESFAQHCIDYGRLPSEIHGLDDTLEIQYVAADGDFFCYATYDAPGVGLRVVWGVATAGSAPMVLGEFPSTAGIPEALACEGTLACVAYRSLGTTDRGWLLIDFVEPGAPVLRSQSATTIRVSALAMADDLLCLAAHGAGIRFLDISNPDFPFETSTLPNVDTGVAAVKDGGVWYVGGNFGYESFVRAYRLSTPSSPVLLGEVTDEGSMDFGSMPLSLAAHGNDVAVLRNNYYVDYQGSTVSNYNIQILDFSSPAAVVQTGRFYYGPNYLGSPAVGNGMVYFPSMHTLNYLEETGGSWSRKYGQRTDSAGISVCVSGNRVFVGDGTRFVEYGNGILSPAPVVGAVSNWNSYGIDLEITSTHAFVSWFLPSDGSIGSEDTGLVVVYDLSDPTFPVPSHTFYAFMGASIGYFAIHGEYAHTDLGSFHWPTGDLAAAHVNMYKDGCLRGDVLYAIEWDGFRVYDLSIPDMPTPVGDDYLQTHHFSTLVQGGNYLYAFSSDLYIFDLLDPLAPVQQSTVSLSEYIRGGTVADGILYLAGSTGLLIYDLATPTNPTLLSQLALGDCRDVAVSGETAYVTSDDAGLVAVDVSEASLPVLLGYFHAGSDAKVVKTGNGYVYALSEHELTVLELQCPSPSGVGNGTLPDNLSPKMHFVPPYPNPFNPVTNLRFELDQAGPVELAIFDGAGRLLRTLVNEYRESGSHIVQWDGRDETGAVVSAGIYFARARSLDGVTIHKLALIK
jgi:hypothetical protein